MKKIDYDAVSEIYDKVRTGDAEMVHQLLANVELSSTSKALDIGCGTANNTLLISETSGIPVCGIDFSKGMLSKAKLKAPILCFLQSPAETLPFQNNCFNFVYMTEVIHHLTDVSSVIHEAFRVLKDGAKFCIVTQSHPQIADRMTSRFFPSTISIDQSRYPTISSIETSLIGTGFSNVDLRVYHYKAVRLGYEYLETLKKRGFSMLHKISQEEYDSGLKKVRNALDAGDPLDYSAGYTFVWATK